MELTTLRKMKTARRKRVEITEGIQLRGDMTFA